MEETFLAAHRLPYALLRGCEAREALAQIPGPYKPLGVLGGFRAGLLTCRVRRGQSAEPPGLIPSWQP